MSEPEQSATGVVWYVVGSRDFPCEGHDVYRCSTCPWEPQWPVASGRLSALELYRFPWSPKHGVDGDGSPHGVERAAFVVADAREQFGDAAVRRVWKEGFRDAAEAEAWALKLRQVHPLEVWPEWGSVQLGVPPGAPLREHKRAEILARLQAEGLY